MFLWIEYLLFPQENFKKIVEGAHGPTVSSNIFYIYNLCAKIYPGVSLGYRNTLFHAYIHSQHNIAQATSEVARKCCGCCNLFIGIALNVRFTMNGMCTKNNTHIYVVRPSNNRVIVTCISGDINM